MVFFTGYRRNDAPLWNIGSAYFCKLEAGLYQEIHLSPPIPGHFAPLLGVVFYEWLIYLTFLIGFILILHRLYGMVILPGPLAGFETLETERLAEEP